MHQFVRSQSARTRRGSIASLSLLAAAALVLTGCSSDASGGGASDAAAAADCDTVTSVRAMMGTSDMDVSYSPYALLAQQLGYMAEECLDVEVTASGTSVTTSQALVSDTADIAMQGPDQLIVAAENEPYDIKIFHNLVTRAIFGLAVLPDADIADYSDLAGATIGVTQASSGYDAYLGKRLEDVGMTLADITQVAVGYGTTPMEALKSGEIDAFLAWPGLWASYENAGYDFVNLPDADWQPDYYGIGLAATSDYIAENPDVVEGFSRAVAKSTVWLQGEGNMEEAVRMFWEEYPERAPLPGTDETEALEAELNILESTMNQMSVLESDDDHLWGSQDAEAWALQIAYDRDAGLVTKDLLPEQFFTNEFNDAANDFDRSAISE